MSVSTLFAGICAKNKALYVVVGAVDGPLGD